MGSMASCRFVSLNVTLCPSAMRTSTPASPSETLPLRQALNMICAGEMPRHIR